MDGLKALSEGALSQWRWGVSPSALALIELLEQSIGEALQPGLAARASRGDRDRITDLQLHPRRQREAMPATGGIPTAA